MKNLQKTEIKSEKKSRKKKVKYDLPINRVVVNPDINNNQSIVVEIELADEYPIPHFYVTFSKEIKGKVKKVHSHIMMNVPEYRRGHGSVKLEGIKKQEFLALMNSKWKGQVIHSRTNLEKSKQATSFTGAIQIWIDAYKDRYPNIHKLFKYDKQGFPILPEYKEKLGKKFICLVEDESKRRKRKKKGPSGISNEIPNNLNIYNSKELLDDEDIDFDEEDYEDED